MTMMKTPFRYPGAKTRLLKKIEPVITPLLNGASIYAEPFVGGGSTLLSVANTHPNLNLAVNDLDNAIASFWTALTDEKATAVLLDLLSSLVPVVEFHEECRTYLDSDYTAIAAFAGLYLNRTSFSGILTSGPIGGKEQKSKWDVGCRYNAKELVKRVSDLHTSLSDKLSVYNVDFFDFLKYYSSIEGVVLYLDPPYYEKGSSLYRHSMSHADHERLANMFRVCSCPWVLSYDGAPEIRDFYSWADIIELPARYSIKGANRSSWSDKVELLISSQ